MPSYFLRACFCISISIISRERSFSYIAFYAFRYLHLRYNFPAEILIMTKKLSTAMRRMMAMAAYSTLVLSSIFSGCGA